MIYIIGWVSCLIAALSLGKSKYSRILEATCLLIFLAIVALSRVGTDLPSYERAAHGMIHLGESFADIFEPGFNMVLQIAAILTGSVVVSVRLVAMLSVLLLMFFWKNADLIEKQYLFYFFLPGWLYSYGMNVLRIGLAFAIFLLAWQHQRRGKALAAWVLKALAITFHLSIIIVIGLQAVFAASKLTIARALAILVTMLGGAAVAYSERDMLVDALYHNATSWLSGIVPVSIMLFVLAGFYFSRAPKRDRAHAVCWVCGLIIIGFGIARFAYVGLRFLDLFAVALPLLLLDKYRSADLFVGKRFLVALALCGLLGAAGTYRGFLLDYGGQRTGARMPFLPHRSVFVDSHYPFRR